MGIFITFEGPEGSGKTTICRMVWQYLLESGQKVILTREPGGVDIAEKIRDIILDNKHTNMDARCEAILYAAARRQHLVEKVNPYLEKNYIVLSDRYLDSSLAYQGYGREIGIDEVYRLNLFATDNKLPDITILFDLDPAIGLARVIQDDEHEKNRLDNEKLSFHQKVREGFLLVAKMFPDRIKIVDASARIDVVFKETLAIIDDFLKANR